MARTSWLLGRRRAAVRWWTRALVEAERLEARPEVARVCREAGERLRDAGDVRARVGGMDGAGLAERARAVGDELATLGCPPAAAAERMQRSA
jgi:hypothetical protein